MATIFSDDYRDMVIRLIEAVQARISDECRAYEDDDEPGDLLTIATEDEGEAFAFQTGDNSYSGACYGYPHWASVGVYRDSSPSDLADDLLENLSEGLPEKPYSVLLLYPDYLAENYGQDTFYTCVEAVNPRHAVAVAREALMREVADWAVSDFAVLLVLEGHHEDVNPEEI